MGNIEVPRNRPGEQLPQNNAQREQIADNLWRADWNRTMTQRNINPENAAKLIVGRSAVENATHSMEQVLSQSVVKMHPEIRRNVPRTLV